MLRAHYAELVSLRVGQDRPGLSAGLPDVDPARPERHKTVNLLVTIRGAAFYDDAYIRRDGDWKIARTGYERIFEEIQDRSQQRGLTLTETWTQPPPSGG